ncbi:MAG: hypothetical protein JSW07_15300 [bacterium]|nr:MAG: hypothetical protein JSW07_15300 [bacterium]
MTKQDGKKIIDKHWGQYEIAEKKVYFWHIGDLKFWCKRTKEEIQIASLRVNSREEQSSYSKEPPEDINWSRWALKQKQTIIKLSPQFPDRPVVVKPESPFRISNGAEARIYIRVPLWVRIELAAKLSATLLEIPIVILSNTWFGNFFEGELCYWISTGARRQIDPDPARPYLAISPNQLINKSEDDLLVEKICLRVANLSLFSDGKQLWSDETKVFYKGVNEVSQVKVGGVPPSEVPAAKLISSPRIPTKKGLAAITFATLKDLPGLGIPIN